MPTYINGTLQTSSQGADDQLDTLAALTAAQVGGLVDLATLEAPGSDGQFVVATGSGVFAYESGSTAFTSIASGGGTVGGVLDITDATDASDNSGDTGALRTEGGASIAKKLYVGTDLDVDGTAELDNITIAGAQGSDGEVLTSTGSGVGWEAAGGGGIERAELWRVTTDNDITQVWDGSPGDAIQVIVNWELNDQSGTGVISSGMTESSGVFTFPATGIWRVDACFQLLGDYFTVHTIDVTEDNSTWVRSNELYIGTYGAHNFAITGPMSFIFDVDNVSLDKVRFGAACQSSSGTDTVKGDSARTESWASFTRLGDT